MAASLSARSLAGALIGSFGLWASAPAMVRVECRSGYARCAHCPKVRPSPIPALRVDCCIVHPALQAPQVKPGAGNHPLPTELPEAADQFPLFPESGAGWSISGPAADPSPPPLQSNRPLLC